MTRVQKERFFNEDDYIRMKDFYILDQSKMDLASPEMLVLHPLPRLIDFDVQQRQNQGHTCINTVLNLFKVSSARVVIHVNGDLTLLNIKVD